LLTLADAEAEEVTFQRDVMAVLSKAGCNAGVCHGNANGKGGFRLSLRGDDPTFDYAAIVRDQLGRRINRLEADKSMLLLKPSLQLPHEGGRRFAPGGPEYNALVRWICSGAVYDGQLPPVERLIVEPSEAVLVDPADELQMRVTAHFRDGTMRDVTRWAVYEPAGQSVAVSNDGLIKRRSFGQTVVLVRYLNQQFGLRVAFVPARPGFVASGPPARNPIDELVYEQLRQLRISPSPLACDRVFLRRAYLDLLGAYPSADEARRFLSDQRDDKRARLIDELLARPEFATYWALRWCDLLRVEEKTLDRKGVANLHHWLRRAIEQAMPLDAMVRALITAQGSTYLHPPANYYRAARDRLTRAEGVAQVFLGIRLQCARCHNHPFDRWRQDDYYDWAAIFAPVDYKIVANQRRDQNDQHEFDGEQIVFVSRRAALHNPRTGGVARPRALGDDRPIDGPPHEQLERLADWLVAPENPFFAQAQANRIWAQLLGRGIVEPVDDFRLNNPPSNPKLLAALAKELVRSRYDLRHLIRLIMNSATYQLASAANDTNADDIENFSHASPRRLGAEQLLDALCAVLDVPARFNGYPPGMQAREIPGVQAVRLRDRPASPADRFLRVFGKPPRLLACDCERASEPSLHQALTMIGGELVNDLLSRPGNRLDRLLALGGSATNAIEALYWTALSRPPTEEERDCALAIVNATADQRAALEDVCWGLANSAEFLLRP
jgi:hypothetical protein